MTPAIAIIERNTLASISLQNVLADIFAFAHILRFSSVREFYADCDHPFVHFFVGSDILMENVEEFDTLRKETIVLSVGPCAPVLQMGYKVLDLSRSEQEIVRDILLMHEGRYQSPRMDSSILDRLSEREKEVLELMVKGQINKQIAQSLCISTATAIFHRNNICQKLGTRSLGKLTVYAVLSGLVSLDEL